MRNIFTPPDERVFEGQSNDNFELLKAWAGTTLAFAVVQSRSNLLSATFLINLLIAGVVCGLAFVLHELAHRIVARNYGAQAHFVANNGWLLISILLSFTGFFIAAPGAVWHRGYLTTRQGGLIALAGPATNMGLAALFFVALAGLIIGRIPAPDVVFQLCYIGFALNGWIGLFNMIPAGPFDGAKVLNWSPLVFGVTVGVGILLAFVLNNDSVLRTLMGLFS